MEAAGISMPILIKSLRLYLSEKTDVSQGVCGTKCVGRSVYDEVCGTKCVGRSVRVNGVKHGLSSESTPSDASQQTTGVGPSWQSTFFVLRTNHFAGKFGPV